MALQWALSPPRTCLNDSMRSRYSTRDPDTENLPNSKGPAFYSPQTNFIKPNPHPSLVTMRLPPNGKTERELTLSNGVDVRHISPVGPGSYEPVDLWTRSRSPAQVNDMLVKKGIAPKSTPRSPPFGGTETLLSSQKRLIGSSDTVGPGTYEPRLPTASPRAVRISSLKRPANDPIPRPAPLSPEELSKLPPVYAETNNVSPPNSAASRGPKISKTPRHFNLHNPNSRTYRHRDMDFAVPPPGWYDANDSFTSRSRQAGRMAGVFSRSPRRIDLARRTAAPGPGLYFSAT